ncbi:MAG: 4-hydroxy-tetrahydrodipicolinate reductase [Sodalis sp. (in: enterobacteria)]
MNNKLIRIAVAGANGRMGRQLIQAVAKSEQGKLCAALSRISSGVCGVDAGELTGIGTLGVMINDNIEEIKDNFDILIDFTCPDASLAYLDFCRQHHKGIVIGTTGFSDIQKKTINSAALETNIVFSANFSVGVNLMLKLLEKTAKIMGAKADIEIIEAHHRHKLDAPSGTALSMGETIAGALGCDLAQCAEYGRKGNTYKRKEKSIGFASIRAGDIVGEHTAIFAEIGERLEITHKASSRMTFSIGAVRAAIWLSDYKKGIFNMFNVLNLD